jgi:hypothetical protein
MNDVNIKIAANICSGDVGLNQEKWLAEEINNLALKFAGLDEIPTLAILPLAHLSANGLSNEQALIRATGIDQEHIAAYLEVLCELKFVNQCSDGYEATDRGKNAFSSIGRNFIIRKRFEMKSRLVELDGLCKKFSLI